MIENQIQLFTFWKKKPYKLFSHLLKPYKCLRLKCKKNIEYFFDPKTAINTIPQINIFQTFAINIFISTCKYFITHQQKICTTFQKFRLNFLEKLFKLCYFSAHKTANFMPSWFKRHTFISIRMHHTYLFLFVLRYNILEWLKSMLSFMMMAKVFPFFSISRSHIFICMLPFHFLF